MKKDEQSNTEDGGRVDRDMELQHDSSDSNSGQSHSFVHSLGGHWKPVEQSEAHNLTEKALYEFLFKAFFPGEEMKPYEEWKKENMSPSISEEPQNSTHNTITNEELIEIFEEEKENLTQDQKEKLIRHPSSTIPLEVKKSLPSSSEKNGDEYRWILNERDNQDSPDQSEPNKENH
jgi:hypothetical protein